MDEQNPRAQRNALLLVVLAVVIAIGGYYVVSSASAGDAPAAPSVKTETATGRGAAGAACPTTQLSTLLGARISKGHSQSASGMGVGVQAVTAGGPAAKAGLKAGDVIVAVNGKPVNCPMTTLNGIRNALAAGDAGSEIALTVDRDSKATKVLLASSLLQPKKTTARATSQGVRTAAAKVHSCADCPHATSGQCPQKSGKPCPMQKATPGAKRTGQGASESCPIRMKTAATRQTGQDACESCPGHKAGVAKHTAGDATKQTGNSTPDACPMHRAATTAG